MLHIQNCVKYLLDSNIDEDDRYYINYQTGELHVNSIDEPVDVNGYCIEYRKNPIDNSIQVFSDFIFHFVSYTY